MVRRKRGKGAPHRRVPEFFDLPVHRDRLVFDGDELVGIICPECGREVLRFAGAILGDCQDWKPSRLEAVAIEESRHWTETLSDQWRYIVRSEGESRKSGEEFKSGARVHLPHCPALRRITTGSNYYGTDDKPTGVPDCRICFGWSDQSS